MHVRAQVLIVHCFCSEWLTEGKIKKLVLALCDVNSKEPLECWEFRIIHEKTASGEVKQEGTKQLKDIQQEIRNVLRQITACVTFLPLLDTLCKYYIILTNLFV